MTEPKDGSGGAARRGELGRPAQQAHPVGATSDTIEITRVVAGGDGVGRLPDGKLCFFSGAYPGDGVRIIELREKRSHAHATRWELIRPSPARTVPACPLAHRCGGCDWMNLEEQAQLKAKREILADCLRRIARVEMPLQQITVHASPASLGYRNRIRIRFGQDQRMGFYARHTHEIVSVRDCPVTTPRLQRALHTLDDFRQKSPGALAPFAEAELRATEHSTSLHLIALKPRRPRVRRRRAANGERLLRRLAPLQEHFTLSMAQDNQVPPNPDRLELDAGPSLLVPPGAFSQVNWAVNQAIVDHLLAGVRARGVADFADLYCGAGNFTLPLLAAGLVGCAVESSAPAIRGARQAARTQGLNEATFCACNAEAWARERAEQRRGFDLVLCDPPRTGIGASLEQMAAIARRYVFLCACDPATYARDLRRFLDCGFSIQAIELYDMFPHTHHFEVVSWLVRSDINGETVQ